MSTAISSPPKVSNFIFHLPCSVCLGDTATLPSRQADRQASRRASSNTKKDWQEAGRRKRQETSSLGSLADEGKNKEESKVDRRGKQTSGTGGGLDGDWEETTQQVTQAGRKIGK